MNYEQILNLVNTVGFPTVACVFLWVILRREMRKATRAVENNTAVVQTLVTLISKYEGREKE